MSFWNIELLDCNGETQQDYWRRIDREKGDDGKEYDEYDRIEMEEDK